MTWTRLTVHWIVSDCDLGIIRCVDYIQVLENTLRAYVLCHKGRGAFALSEIRLQQQLPGEYTYGTI